MPELKDVYLFQYSFETEKSKMILKLDKHEPHSGIKSFKWDEKEKVIEINYTGKENSAELVEKFKATN